MRRVALLALALVALATVSARAHLMPNSVILLDFGPRKVTADIVLPLNDVAAATGRDRMRGDAADKAFIASYVREHLDVRAPDGRAWSVAVGAVTIDASGGGVDARVPVMLAPPAGAPVRRFTLHWDGVIDRLANHFVLVFTRTDFATGTLESSPELLGGLQGTRRTISVDRARGSAFAGFAASFGLGMRHIAEGYDHLLFLFSLLLPAPATPGGRRWGEFSGARIMVRRLVAIVSAFTFGHSATLVGGAVFNWRLPAQPIEVMIAVTVLVSALHAWRPLFAGREPVVAALFGLVHGLAFATVIGNFQLDPGAKALAILGFNLGIETVQLLLVALALPVLLMIASRPLYPRVRVAGAVMVGAAALVWIWQRVAAA